MLDHLRERVAQTLAQASTVTLSTGGPAGLQASLLPCQAAGSTLYLLLPSTSEHLVNLGSNPDALVSTPAWQLRGKARILPASERAALGDFAGRADARWCEVVVIEPVRLEIAREDGWGFQETIDL